MVSDRTAVSGQPERDVIRLGLAQRPAVGEQRLGALTRRLVELAADQGVGGDPGEQMVAEQGEPVAGVEQHRVGGRMTRPVEDLEVAIAQGQAVARRHGAVGAGGGPVPAGDRRHRPQRVGDVGLDAVADHQRARLIVTGGGEALPVGQHGGEEIEAHQLGARALGEHAGQAGMVEVLVGDEDELEVRDAMAGISQPSLHLAEGGGGVGAAVDQGERVALDQVGVDRPHRERRLDRHLVDAGGHRGAHRS